MNPPATDDGLKAASDWFGHALAADVEQAYRVADGQQSTLPGVLFGMPWLSLQQARQEYQIWQDIAAEDTSLHSQPEGAIQSVNFSPAWFPFAVDGGGNGLAVDLAPGSTGTVGQVITYGPDEQTRRVIAPSLTAFFEWAANEVRAGHLTMEGQDVRLNGASSLLDEFQRLF